MNIRPLTREALGTISQFILYFYVCGLKSKLLNPDFVDLIRKHDILVFVETKLDELDVINLPDGYSYHCKNRKKCKKKSGGIINLQNFTFQLY